MASTQITTSTDAGGLLFGNAHAVEKAGNRVYCLYQDGSNVKLAYSDDTALATWSVIATAVKVSAARYGCLLYDSTNARLEIYYGGTTGGNEPLFHRAITSNVTTGVPGSFSTEITIDAGGASAGVEWISAVLTPTVTRPRVWLMSAKYTAATTREVRMWYCDAGTATDTAINYTAVTNVMSLSSAGGTQAQNGQMTYQKIGGTDYLFAVAGDVSVTPNRLAWIIFDPTTATPATAISGATKRTGLAVASGAFDNWEATGPMVWASSINDYIVVGRRDPSSGKVDWSYSTDGITFTAATSGSFTAGRSAVSTDGTDFHILHSDTFGTLASSAQTMSYRKLTKSSNTVGGASVFSDANGNSLQVPTNTGTSALFAVYRSSTASPFSVRADVVSIFSDTTAPGAATSFTATAASSTQINLSAVMPSDPDVAFYELRRLSGTTYPATDRSNGTIAVASTATTAGATVTFNDTGLTGGTTYSYRLFVRDATGNWNTGTTVQCTARSKPAFSQRYKADGTTTIADGTTAAGEAPVFEYTIAATDFNGTGVAHIRARFGTDNATPPALNTFDVYSGSGGSNWRYETSNGSGVYLNWPATGLPTSAQTVRKIRLYSPSNVVGQLYHSWRIEQ